MFGTRRDADDMYDFEADMDSKSSGVPPQSSAGRNAFGTTGAGGRPLMSSAGRPLMSSAGSGLGGEARPMTSVLVLVFNRQLRSKLEVTLTHFKWVKDQQLL
jgi:hypothetical protein